MAQTVADVLAKAADLIETKGWTQGAYARDSSGQVVGLMSPNASCFCLRGALVRVGAVRLTEESNSLTRALGFTSAKKMADWNDEPHRTKEQVIARICAAARDQGK